MAHRMSNVAVAVVFASVTIGIAAGGSRARSNRRRGSRPVPQLSPD